MQGTQQVLSWDYSAYPSLSQVTITLENTGGCGFTQAPVSLATGIAANTGVGLLRMNPHGKTKARC
jgi:hypothetical protein